MPRRGIVTQLNHVPGSRAHEVDYGTVFENLLQNRRYPLDLTQFVFLACASMFFSSSSRASFW
jgi:hypothetical protein